MIQPEQYISICGYCWSALSIIAINSSDYFTPTQQPMVHHKIPYWAARPVIGGHIPSSYCPGFKIQSPITDPKDNQSNYKYLPDECITRTKHRSNQLQHQLPSFRSVKMPKYTSCLEHNISIGHSHFLSQMGDSKSVESAYF